MNRRKAIAAIMGDHNVCVTNKETEVTYEITKNDCLQSSYNGNSHTVPLYAINRSNLTMPEGEYVMECQHKDIQINCSDNGRNTIVGICTTCGTRVGYKSTGVLGK